MAFNWNDRYGDDKNPPPHPSERKTISELILIFLERYGKGRCFFATFAMLTALLITIIVFGSISHRRFNFEGETLRLTGITHDGVTMVDSNGNNAVLTILDGMSWQWMTVSATYQNRTVTREATRTGFETVYTFSDGTRWYTQFVRVSFGDGSDNLPPISEGNRAERDLLRHMVNYHINYTTVGTYVLLTLAMMLVILIGMLNVFFPSAMWRLRTFMYVRDGEPTDFYIVMSFICGVILVISAFIMTAVTVFS